MCDISKGSVNESKVDLRKTGRPCIQQQSLAVVNKDGERLKAQCPFIRLCRVGLTLWIGWLDLDRVIDAPV